MSDQNPFYEKSQVTYHIKDAVTNIVADTIQKNKQALVFVNSKRSAESVAKKLTTFLKKKRPTLGADHHFSALQPALQTISERAVQQTQTKQCLTLASCLKEGIAFHHAGLTSHQRSLIENEFRAGTIKVICCTPTLAIGMDLPAYRVIIRDVKRFSPTGIDFIPTLEYEQIAGRAGRPGKETEGEAIVVTTNPAQQEEVLERYINGSIEKIYSKLAVEPVFRTYLLSLIASGFVRTRKDCIDFFSQTFWSYQYRDKRRLTEIIDRMLMLLENFEFITQDRSNDDNKTSESTTSGFQSAATIGDDETRGTGPTITATPLGKRVSELYIDPLSANIIIHALKFRITNGNDLFEEHEQPALEIPINKAAEQSTPITVHQKRDFDPSAFSWIHLFCRLLEIRPLLRIRTSDMEFLDQALISHEEYLFYPIPSQFEFEYEDFMAATKTALFLEDWVSETDEETLLEKYNVRPGETRAKIDVLDWLLYASYELCVLLGYKPILKELTKLRERVKYGVREELLNLLRLKGVGRVRARMLFSHNIKSVRDLKRTSFDRLASIVGNGIARKLKEQLDQPVPNAPKSSQSSQKTKTSAPDTAFPSTQESKKETFNPGDLSHY
jgi:helicase